MPRTPPLSFLQAGCPSCCPTNSVKALKHPPSHHSVRILLRVPAFHILPWVQTLTSKSTICNCTVCDLSPCGLAVVDETAHQTQVTPHVALSVDAERKTTDPRTQRRRRRRRHRRQPEPVSLIAKFHYTGPTRTRTFLRRNSVGSVRVRSGPCPCRARVRVHVVEFSYKYTHTPV